MRIVKCITVSNYRIITITLCSKGANNEGSTRNLTHGSDQ
jgi:hypothetical protein